jgi:hypothetical protein
MLEFSAAVTTRDDGRKSKNCGKEIMARKG